MRLQRLFWALLFTLLASTAFADLKACRLAVSYRAELDPKGISYQIRRWTQGSLVDRSDNAYTLTERDIVELYAQIPETQNLFSVLEAAPTTQKYTINARGEIQAQDWYRYSADLKGQQLRWSFDVRKFIEQQGTVDFNSAKKKFYSQQPFDLKTFRHQLPYAPMKEWAGLNHPPLDSLKGQDLSKYSKNFKPLDYTSSQFDGSRYFDVEFHRKLDKKTDSQLTRDNELIVLEDEQSHFERLRQIRQAKFSIYMSSLVFTKEARVQELVDALIERAQAGVDVRILAEKSMSLIHGSMLRKLEKNGVKVIRANDFFNYNSFAIYHSKVFLRDGEVAMIGGINQIDADVGSKGTDMKNRDLDTAVRGPVVTDITYHFMEDWNHFANKSKWLGKGTPHFTEEQFLQIERDRRTQELKGQRGEKNYATWLHDREQRMRGLARYIAQKPYKDVSVITQALIEHLDAVTEYWGFTNPQALDTKKEDYPKTRGLRLFYDSFKNFNALFDKMQELLRNRPQVHVDLVTSGAEFGVNEAVPMTRDRIRKALDQPRYTILNKIYANLNQVWLDTVNILIAPKQYQNLLKDFGPYPQVDTWIHTSFIHAKVMIFDRLAISFGSLNPHHNATDHAYEVTLIVQDASFAALIDQAMVLDMANSVPLVFQSKP